MSSSMVGPVGACAPHALTTLLAHITLYPLVAAAVALAFASGFSWLALRVRDHELARVAVPAMWICLFATAGFGFLEIFFLISRTC